MCMYVLIVKALVAGEILILAQLHSFYMRADGRVETNQYFAIFPELVGCYFINFPPYSVN